MEEEETGQAKVQGGWGEAGGALEVTCITVAQAVQGRWEPTRLAWMRTWSGETLWVFVKVWMCFFPRRVVFRQCPESAPKRHLSPFSLLLRLPASLAGVQVCLLNGLSASTFASPLPTTNTAVLFSKPKSHRVDLLKTLHWLPASLRGRGYPSPHKDFPRTVWLPRCPCTSLTSRPVPPPHPLSHTGLLALRPQGVGTPSPRPGGLSSNTSTTLCVTSFRSPTKDQAIGEAVLGHLILSDKPTPIPAFPSLLL